MMSRDEWYEYVSLENEYRMVRLSEVAIIRDSKWKDPKGGVHHFTKLVGKGGRVLAHVPQHYVDVRRSLFGRVCDEAEAEAIGKVLDEAVDSYLREGG